MAKRKTKSTKKKKAAKKARRNPAYQVFVSHATADKWLATTFCEKIDATGATSFRDDRDINGGDNIPETIRTEIQVSRELVVLLTPDSIERPWVLLEVGAAWGRRKNYRIVPVLCHVSLLAEIYSDIDVPADRLSQSPRELQELVNRFNAGTKRQLSGSRILSELLRMRKQSKLPRLGTRSRVSKR
jgi:hypothetical protein